MSFLVRKAKKSDVRWLAEAWYEMSLEIWRKQKCPIYKPKPHEKFVSAAFSIFSKKVRDKKYMVFVAVNDGELVGFVVARIDCYTPSVFVQDKITYIEKLFVAEKYRRKGIGSALITKVLDEANTKIVYLSTEISKRNIFFYRKLGFKKYQYKLMKVLK